MNNIHATLVSYKNNGILFIGESGSGKSDLALRMIMENGATLVADDYVSLKAENGELFGQAPREIFGKIEVRGIGIIPINSLKKERITLCVELIKNRNEIERMPYPEEINFLGVSVTKIKLYPFDCSTICKIVAKINGIIN